MAGRRVPEVSPETLAALRAQATATPTVEAVLARVAGRSGGSVPLAAAVAVLREDRDRR
jgi:hypothetical protein